jgi:hypothetical protein
MANTKISALPAAGVGEIAAGEFAIASGGVTKKISGSNLNTHIQTTLEATYNTLGVVELATVQEVSDGLDAERVITPDAYRKAVPFYIIRNGGYNLALTDKNTDQWCNVALTCNIPVESSVNFETGTTIPFLRLTDGVVTIDAAGGVTLNGVNGGSCTIRTQYQGALLKKIGTDTWVISGDVSAVA